MSGLPHPVEPPDGYVRDLKGMDAADLLATYIPPRHWAVAGLIPCGLSILASPPKTGKSLLCYQIAVAVAIGADLLGHKVERRHVRYYALEDGPGRSQDRILALGIPDPGWLSIRWEAPLLGEDGRLEDELESYLTEYPDGVIIIDVLAKVRPAGGKGNAYDEDYRVLQALKALCRSYPDAVILLVTHDRKAGSDDYMTRITGTRGISGSVDTVLFLDRKRGETVGTIRMSGRDLADDDLTVKLVGTHWEVATLGDMMATPTISTTRQRIFDWVTENGPTGPLAIAKGTGLSHDSVKPSGTRHGH